MGWDTPSILTHIPRSKFEKYYAPVGASDTPGHWGVAEQFLRGPEIQLIFESTPGCLLKLNIKFKFKFIIIHSF